MKLDPWVERAIGVLAPDVRDEFVLDPLSTLTGRLGMKVRAVSSLADARAGGGLCDGMSFLSDDVVLYAPTPDSRRQNFTLAHELGHWIVSRDQGLLDWISDQDRADVVLESVCDRMAQRLLLPADLVRDVVGDGKVRAHHVGDLFDSSAASYPACAIAVAGQIRRLGAVVLIDRFDRTVYHASVVPDPDEGWPTVYPWRGQVLPEAHPLLEIEPGQSRTRRISWRAPWGNEVEFFADAVAGDSRVIAVFADHDIWEIEPGRVLAPREYDIRPAGVIFCCGEEQKRKGYPCNNCGEQFCKFCGKCRCDRNAAAERQCLGCFVLKQPQLLVDDLCENCR